MTEEWNNCETIFDCHLKSIESWEGMKNLSSAVAIFLSKPRPLCRWFTMCNNKKGHIKKKNLLPPQCTKETYIGI